MASPSLPNIDWFSRLSHRFSAGAQRTADEVPEDSTLADDDVGLQGHAWTDAKILRDIVQLDIGDGDPCIEVGSPRIAGAAIGRRERVLGADLGEGILADGLDDAFAR